MLTTLRKGRAKRPLFVFPGAGGRGKDLAGLASLLRGSRPVIAVAPFEPGPGGRLPATVEEMAAKAASALQKRQPRGPYYLLGYSFGGLVAIETARLLREQNEKVAFLGMIDAVYDRRYWAGDLFLASQARRTVQHLKALARRPLASAAPEFFRRAARLGRRIAGRAGGPAEVKPHSGALQALCERAMAAWKPRPYDGRVHLFSSTLDEDFGCAREDLWRPLIADLEVRRVDGSHLALVRDPTSLAALAGAIDRAVSSSLPNGRSLVRKVLLATSFTWLNATRLALAFSEAGFTVEAVCPRAHSLTRVAFVDRTHRLRPTALQRSLAAAIGASRPDLIVPCDDRTAAQLHLMLQALDERPETEGLRQLLTRSLASPGAVSSLYSRAAIMDVAAEEYVPRPDTAPADTWEDVAAFADRQGYPLVLKTDGSWGGRGVVVAGTESEAQTAYRRLSANPSPVRGLKRWLVDGDTEPLAAFLTRRRPKVSVQAFAPGTPGNAAVACLNGRVLGAVYAEVVRTDGDTGPATVVRVIDHPEMAFAVQSMVRRLGLSGLCGFDFMLDRETGGAMLIEINPRATPTAHLVGADGADLPAALLAGLKRTRPPRPRKPYEGGLVALFPQELRRDPDSGFLASAHHDVPWQAPALVRLALDEDKGRSARINRVVRRMRSAVAVTSAQP